MNHSHFDSDHTRRLVEACQRQERQAQYKVYQLYNKAMYNIVLRMVGNSEDAQDVLQDAFVSAFKNIAQYSGKATLGAWIKRIVINKSIDHLKKRRLKIVDIENVAYKMCEEEVDNQPFYEVAPGRVHDEIKGLPEGCRVVFSLYMLEGYDHREISQILGVSESTSKSQFSRAKKLLRERLSVG